MFKFPNTFTSMKPLSLYFFLFCAFLSMAAYGQDCPDARVMRTDSCLFLTNPDDSVQHVYPDTLFDLRYNPFRIDTFHLIGGTGDSLEPYVYVHIDADSVAHLPIDSVDTIASFPYTGILLQTDSMRADTIKLCYYGLGSFMDSTELDSTYRDSLPGLGATNMIPDCPEETTLTKNDQCIFLEWESIDSVPLNLPQTIYESTTCGVNAESQKFVIVEGSGTGAPGDPVAYIEEGSPPESCNANGILQPEVCLIDLKDGVSCSYINGLLPITLVSFEAVLTSNNVELVWYTASEQQNQGFEIQRSTDGVSWEKMGWVDGQGESSVLTAYTFHDKLARGGTYYYRLRQVDIDGAFSLSPIVTLNYSGDDNAIFLAPNPVIDKLLISVHEEARMDIYDITGKLVMSSPLLEEFEIDFSSYPRGMYLVNIILADGHAKIFKIVKR